MLVLKGREKYNREWARYKLNEFLKMITVEYKTTMEQRFIGKGIVMQITKNEEEGFQKIKNNKNRKNFGSGQWVSAIFAPKKVQHKLEEEKE